MSRLLKARVNLGFLVNPFYLYCLSFSLAIFFYLLGWCNIFPKLSATLLLFFAFTFVLFIFAGYQFGKRKFLRLNTSSFSILVFDLTFWLIIILGILNVLLMGYLPVLDRSHNYREFGFPVIDTLFNSLSIFFAVFCFHSFLINKNKKLLIYVAIILVFQLLLFRRSTIVWILTSSSFLILAYYRRINLLALAAGIICIPLLSYCFGLYGNTRSNLTKSIVLNDLGASETFKRTGISYNNYITYLYISSPLANLQKNVDEGKGFLNNGDLKGFILYSIIPESFTMRLNRIFDLESPCCSLITPQLIVGSFLMVSFFTLGWLGIIVMVFYLLAFILLCLYLLSRQDSFQLTTLCILSTAVSLLIFSNFLNRLDVILMLFIYPAIFQLIYSGRWKVVPVRYFKR